MKSTNHALGASAERYIAGKINDAVKGHNIIRFGGIEKHKHSFLGDIGCLKFDKQGKKTCIHDHCVFDDLFFDVKRWKKPALNAFWKKILDDCPINRVPVVIWWAGHGDWRVREGSSESAYDDMDFDEWLKNL